MKVLCGCYQTLNIEKTQEVYIIYKCRDFELYSQTKIGESVQIDHIVRTLNGYTYRIFVACDKKSKWAYAEPFIKAKRTFLVDEDIEFIETTIPKINGNMERINRIITEEFLHETPDSLVVY